MVRVTCVELPDSLDLVVWGKLVKHIENSSSELLVLNEMPAYPWIAHIKEYDQDLGKESVKIHKDFLNRIGTLGLPVISSRPILEENRLYNEAFVINNQRYTPVHTKHYFPDEEGFYEARWFKRKEKAFNAFKIGKLNAGVMLCTDLWFSEYARAYGKQGVHVIIVPRATSTATLDRWIVGLRHAAIVSGAYVVSSNRLGKTMWNDFSGNGCIIDPDGEILGTTSRDLPFITMDIDLESADLAKKQYPRYVAE
jgi:N-carbamoylputrescine amidase